MLINRKIRRYLERPGPHNVWVMTSSAFTDDDISRLQKFELHVLDTIAWGTKPGLRALNLLSRSEQPDALKFFIENSDQVSDVEIVPLMSAC
jgi:hypothetical protein